MLAAVWLHKLHVSVQHLREHSRENSFEIQWYMHSEDGLYCPVYFFPILFFGIPKTHDSGLQFHSSSSTEHFHCHSVLS